MKPSECKTGADRQEGTQDACLKAGLYPRLYVTCGQRPCFLLSQEPHTMSDVCSMNVN